MHHTNPKPGRLLWSTIMGFALTGVAVAQQPGGQPMSPMLPVIVTGQSTDQAKVPAKAPAKEQAKEQPKEPAKEQAKPGSDQAKQARALLMSIGGSQKLGMSTKKKLVSVDNPRSTIVRAQQVEGDPSVILLTGLEAGQARVTLKDEDGKEEAFDISVQLDIEYLKTVLQKAVPTANLTLIPSSSNSIIISGSVARPEDMDIVMRTAQGIIGGQDRVVNAMRIGGVHQVQLDVVIAQVSRGEFRRMSFDFINDGRNHLLSSTVSGGFIVPSGPITGTFPGGPVISNGLGLPNGTPANFFLGVFNSQQDFFGLLQCLRDENVLKLLAKPSLVTISGRNASFLSGGEQAIPVPAGLGQVGVQFEEFGTRLNFLPIVLGNGKIHLEVEPEVSNLDAAFGTAINGTVVPGRTTQRIHTTVELEDGQSFVLGGLIQHNVTGDTRKVPVLGDLPFLGAAFRRIQYNESESELVIMVTVHLVDALSCDQTPKVFPGQETRSPDDFELFLEGILEAPRGPREVFAGKRYVPAYKNGPTAGTYPCAGGCAPAKCGTPGCGPQASPSCNVPCGPTTATGTGPGALPVVGAVLESKPAPVGGLVTLVEPGMAVAVTTETAVQPKALSPAILPTSGKVQ